MFFFYLALHFLFLKLPRVLFHYLKLFSCSLQNYFPPKLTNYFSKTSSTNDANILAVNIPDLKGKPKEQSFEQDLLDMLEKLQQLRLEKEKTDELLKAKDEILKQKDEELQNSGKEQENLQIEFKKLQKLKEFKPTTNFPMVKDKEQKKKDRKGALTWYLPHFNVNYEDPHFNVGLLVFTIHVNYEDPHFNVGLLVFTIHGNYDDPTDVETHRIVKR
ncbi:uncharacterized protein [Cicer arietinum]|uniref:uncharacterized protein isoform X1 n=1 Tax=Cicer arietinum TaxID=3827 RepID=UPI003CC6B49B